MRHTDAHKCEEWNATLRRAILHLPGGKLRGDLPRHAADHEQTQGEKAGKNAPDGFDSGAERRHSFDQILPNEKDGLNAADVAACIFQHDVTVLEA